MKQLGYNSGIKTRRLNIVTNFYDMPQKKKEVDKIGTDEGESFETLQLKKRIVELAKQLKDAELKA